MTKEARSPNDELLQPRSFRTLRRSTLFRSDSFVLRHWSFFRHSCFVIRHYAVGAILIAGTVAQGAPAPLSLHSRSGQFVVSGVPMLTRSYADSTSVVSFIRLDPALVAVSCEGIKTALLEELGLPDHWRGGITISLRPVLEDNEPIDVTSVHYKSGWTYRLSVPEQVDRSRFIKAIVEVLLFEIANREAGSRPAELPPWLVPGLAAHLEATSLVGLTLEPRTSLIGQTRRRDVLIAIRDSLRPMQGLTIDQLDWPQEPRTEQQSQIYDTSAELLVYDLLRLKNGRRCMADMLKRLHQVLNWQTAFFQAFAPHFQRLLDLDKWWAMRLAELSRNDPLAVLSAEDQWRELDGILEIRTVVAANTNQPPVESSVTLQTVISQWPLAEQFETLQQAAGLLRVLQRKSKGPAAHLMGEYATVLQQYLQNRSREQSAHGRGGDSTSRSHIFSQTTIRELNRLDARRRAVQEGSFTGNIRN